MHCVIPFCWGVEPSTKFSKGPQLDTTSTFRGELLFSGKCCNFYIKDKLKSEIFNDKKSL